MWPQPVTRQQVDRKLLLIYLRAPEVRGLLHLDRAEPLFANHLANLRWSTTAVSDRLCCVKCKHSAISIVLANHTEHKNGKNLQIILMCDVILGV